MTEDQRLSMLDSRASAARAALDDAVEQVSIPDHDLGSPSRRIRRFLPLAVAAGVVVVALVGALLAFDDDEQSTIAGQPEGITRLALPDPESLGYRIVGAFDGSRSGGIDPELNIAMTIHSPADAERWERPVVSYSLDADRTSLSGESVDVGGPEAVISPSVGTPMIGWSEGERVRFVGGPGYSAEELTALVARTIAEGVPDGAPLPEHEIVHVAPYTDLYPALIMSSSIMASDVAGIGYARSGSSSTDPSDLVDAEDMFAVATSAGSGDRWRASFALAVDVEHLTVRGHDAVRADFGDGLTEISWLEDGGTLVRVDAYGSAIPLDVLEELEPISDTDFANLVEEHGEDGGVEETVHAIEENGEELEAPDVDGGPQPTIPDDGTSATTIDERVPVAEVSTEDGDVTMRATLQRGRNGFEVELYAESPSSGSGRSQPVPDPNTNLVLRDRFASDGWTGVLIGGVIGPDVQSVNVVDAETDEVLDGASTATIEDSGHVVFLTTLRDEYATRDLAVVGTTAAGEEVRLSAPAQP